MVYEFFNVLWVLNADNGVAYRAACGYVLKDFWEAGCVVERTVTLGKIVEE